MSSPLLLLIIANVTLEGKLFPEKMKKQAVRFFTFLASMNLAIFLLSASAFLIIVQVLTGRFPLLTMEAPWFEVIASDDFYHSTGFQIILIAFCANLFACSINRLPKTITQLKNPSKQFNNSDKTSVHFSEHVKMENLDESMEIATSVLTTHFRKPVLVSKEGDHYRFYAEKGRYAHLGFFLAHISILAIVVGVFLSSSGYEYTLTMVKNQLLDPVIVQDATGSKKPLGFSLLCEEIKTVYYPGTSQVKNRQSVLSILVNGEKIKTRVVDFSHPLSYGGVEIFQDHIMGTKLYARLKAVSPDGRTYFYDVSTGECFILKDTGITLIAGQIKLSSNALELKNPLSTRSIVVTDKPASFNQGSIKDYRFNLVEFLHKNTLFLKIRKDPGKELIWYATWCMLFGFTVIFLIPHRQLWLNGFQEKDGITITLAGATSKHPGSFDRLCAHIIQKIKEKCRAEESPGS